MSDQQTRASGSSDGFALFSSLLEAVCCAAAPHEAASALQAAATPGLQLVLAHPSATVTKHLSTQSYGYMPRGSRLRHPASSSQLPRTANILRHTTQFRP